MTYTDILELGNMELVFALVTYMGINKIDVSYFRSIDDCKYFAERLNNQPPVPSNEDGPKPRYVAICQPSKVNLDRTKVY